MATAPLTSSLSTSGKVEGRWARLSENLASGQLETRGSPLPSFPFREFRFTSEVPICLDYHGKHVTVDQVVSGSIGQAV